MMRILLNVWGAAGGGRPRIPRWGRVALWCVVGTLGLMGLDLRSGAAESSRPAVQPDLIAVARPPFSEGIYPCSDCHDGTDVNTTRREVPEHEDIVLNHDSGNRWCLDCHDATNRDKLHLADGRLLDFTDSYLLCGQCHGPKLRDWRAGDHGKRTGSWSGEKQYLLCVHCHNPHSPKFKPMKPMPPPVRPEDL